MRVVFISPDFPENFYHFCTELADRGHQVLGLSATPYERVRPELRTALTEYYRVDTLDHIDSLRGAIRHFIGRWGPIDAIESLNEHWLETEAQLRAEFDVPGWKPQDMAPIKRKSVMKQHFVDAGLDVAPGRMLRSPRRTSTSSSPRSASRWWPSPTSASAPRAPTRSPVPPMPSTSGRRSQRPTTSLRRT